MKVDITKIKVDRTTKDTKRFRSDLGDIAGLSDSIKRKGLIHPITVNKISDDSYNLIAGERRLRACLLAGFTEVSVTIREDSDDVDRKEIELEENLQRKDIDWPEKVEALRQLDELKRNKYGDASTKPLGKDGGGGWGLKQTAEVTNQSVAAVSQDIALANKLRQNPDLAKKLAKLPKHAARKKIKQQEEADRLKRQIDSRDLVIDSSLKLGSCTDLIKDIDDNSIHLLLTDPPFAANIISSVASGSKSGKGFGGANYNTTKTNVGIEETMAKTYAVLIPELYRVLVPGAHFYIFFGHTWYCRLHSMLKLVGFQLYDQPIIWDKGKATMIPKDSNYMSSYEAILYGYKPPLTRLLRRPTKNVISIPPIVPQARTHPLQRPYALLKILIENSTSPGETVLDCFAGSASTLIAARILQRKSIGFELDESNYLIAQRDMKKVLKDKFM